MKHLLLLLDGLAGEASPELEGRTPLEVAERPTLDELTREGRPAAIDPDPWGRATTEDALAGLLVGLDPAVDPLGAAVLAAAARRADRTGGVLDSAVRPDIRGAGDPADPPNGTDLAAAVATVAAADSPISAEAGDDVLLALDLVTIEAGVMLHADAGGLTDEEGRTLAAALAPLAAETLDPAATIEPLGGHRLGLRLPAEAAPDGLGLHPAEAVLGQPVADARPVGERSAPLRAFMRRAEERLAEHELAELRRDARLPRATHAWPWGPGRPGRRLDLSGRYEGRRFAVVGSGLTEAGLAALAGLAVRRPAAPAASPEGPAAFVSAVVAALHEADAVLAWWRPAIRSGDGAARAAAATATDRHVVGPLRAHLARELGPAAGGWRLAVIAGPPRGADGRLLDDPLVAAFAGTGFHGPLELPFVEASAVRSELRLKPGDDLLDFLLFGAGVRRPRRPRRRGADGSRTDEPPRAGVPEPEGAT